MFIYGIGVIKCIYISHTRKNVHKLLLKVMFVSPRLPLYHFADVVANIISSYGTLTSLIYFLDFKHTLENIFFLNCNSEKD